MSGTQRRALATQSLRSATLRGVARIAATPVAMLRESSGESWSDWATMAWRESPSDGQLTSEIAASKVDRSARSGESMGTLSGPGTKNPPERSAPPRRDSPPPNDRHRSHRCRLAWALIDRMRASVTSHRLMDAWRLSVSGSPSGWTRSPNLVASCLSICPLEGAMMYHSLSSRFAQGFHET